MFGIFQPDVLTPVQYLSPPLKWSPERRLLAAVLKDAIDRFRTYRGIRTMHAQMECDEVEAWMTGYVDTSEDNWFSFKMVCEALGLDEECVRTAVLGW